MSRANPIIRSAGLLLVATLALAASASRAEPDLSAPESLAAARMGKLILVDIRTPQEWRETGVAEGALRVNLYHPAGPQGFAAELLAQVGGDKSAPIGLICRIGNRTTAAQRYLKSLGFTRVFNIREGMAGSNAGPGWLKRGLPVEPCAQC